MRKGIECLEISFDMLFNNRHGCGWGYRPDELDNRKKHPNTVNNIEYQNYIDQRKKYREYQNERAEELRSMIKCIRILREKEKESFGDELVEEKIVPDTSVFFKGAKPFKIEIEPETPLPEKPERPKCRWCSGETRPMNDNGIMGLDYAEWNYVCSECGKVQ